jgi:hypothetical protein
MIPPFVYKKEKKYNAPVLLKRCTIYKYKGNFFFERPNEFNRLFEAGSVFSPPVPAAKKRPVRPDDSGLRC